MVLDGELLDVKAARSAFDSVLALRADDSMAKEAIDELDVAEKNWKKFADNAVAVVQVLAKNGKVDCEKSF